MLALHLWHKYASQGCVEIFWAYCRKTHCVITSVCCIMSFSSFCMLFTNHNRPGPIFGCFERRRFHTIQRERIRICFISVTTTLFCILWSVENPTLIRYLCTHQYSENLSLVHSDWIVHQTVYAVCTCGPMSSNNEFDDINGFYFQSRREMKHFVCVCVCKWRGDGWDAATAPDSAVTRL